MQQFWLGLGFGFRFRFLPLGGPPHWALWLPFVVYWFCDANKACTHFDPDAQLQIKLELKSILSGPAGNIIYAEIKVFSDFYALCVTPSPTHHIITLAYKWGHSNGTVMNWNKILSLVIHHYFIVFASLYFT